MGNGDGFHTCSDVLLEKRCEDEEGKERSERKSFRLFCASDLAGRLSLVRRTEKV